MTDMAPPNRPEGHDAATVRLRYTLVIEYDDLKAEKVEVVQ